MADMRASLAEFGADPSALRLLDNECPELLPYATLLTARRNRNAALGVVDAVYEWQGAPLVFLVDADSVKKNDLAPTPCWTRIRGELKDDSGSCGGTIRRSLRRSSSRS